MQIQPARLAVVPRSVRKELLSQENHSSDTPGIIVSIGALSTHNPDFVRALAGLAPANALARTPALVIPPRETSRVFEHSEELALLKSVAALIAQQVHPHLKTGIDALWLVYRAAQLREEWSQPHRDTVACGFKMTDLALSAAGMVGDVYPGLALPDSWANGFDYVLSSGQAIHEGKTVPVNELAFATDKRLDIPLTLLKLAGLSLDPQAYGQSLPGTFARPTLSPLVANPDLATYRNR